MGGRSGDVGIRAMAKCAVVALMAELVFGGDQSTRPQQKPEVFVAAAIAQDLLQNLVWKIEDLQRLRLKPAIDLRHVCLYV